MSILARVARFGRRPVMRGIAAGLMVLSLAGWDYGGDSGTANAQPGAPTGNYLGKIVEADGGCYSGFAFNTSTTAPNSDIYGYNFLHGPSLAMTGQQAYDYGVSQANAAWNCWLSGPNAARLYGLNIWGDVEAGSSGTLSWYYANANDHSPNSTWQKNVNVVAGFVSTIQSHTYSGIYIGTGAWGQLFNSWGWGNQWFPIWMSGGCGGNNVHAGGTNIPAVGAYWESRFNNLHSLNQQGSCRPLGQNVLLWQYNCCPSPDYNITPIMDNAGSASGFQGNFFPNGY